MYSRSRASKNRCSQKSVTFQNEISMKPLFYEPHLLAVKISESCILSIQLYAGSKFVLSILYVPLKDVHRQQKLMTDFFQTFELTILVVTMKKNTMFSKGSNFRSLIIKS